MGSIGAPELIVMLFILMLLVGVPVLVVVLVLRSRSGGDLVPCRACGRRISPRAPTCPQCGELRPPLHG